MITMQVNIKIDDNLYSKLKENAKENHRTITAQLGVILSNVLETKENNNNNITETSDKNHINAIESDHNNAIETSNKKPRSVIIGSPEEGIIDIEKGGYDKEERLGWK